MSDGTALSRKPSKFDEVAAGVVRSEHDGLTEVEVSPRGSVRRGDLVSADTPMHGWHLEYWNPCEDP